MPLDPFSPLESKFQHIVHQLSNISHPTSAIYPDIFIFISFSWPDYFTFFLHICPDIFDFYRNETIYWFGIVKTEREHKQEGIAGQRSHASGQNIFSRAVGKEFWLFHRGKYWIGSFGSQLFQKGFRHWWNLFEPVGVQK